MGAIAGNTASFTLSLCPACGRLVLGHHHGLDPDCIQPHDCQPRPLVDRDPGDED